MYSDLQGFGSMLNIWKMEYWGCGHMVECFPNKNRAPSSISSATEKKARRASADRCSGTQKVGEQGGKIYCDFLFKYLKWFCCAVSIWDAVPGVNGEQYVNIYLCPPQWTGQQSPYLPYASPQDQTRAWGYPSKCTSTFIAQTHVYLQTPMKIKQSTPLQFKLVCKCLGIC